MKSEDNGSLPSSRLRRLLGILHVDRAVVYALSVRIWQLFGGAVTVILIGTFFSRDVQGFYYTFASILALRSFFELGFSIVITNVSSHEWARLKLDERGGIVGKPEARSRLISLGRLIFRWYAAAAVLFIVLVGAGGTWFLGLSAEAQEVTWQSPWLVLVVLNGLLLWTLPFVSLLEGCNQVANVNRFRLIQAVCANACVWSVVLLEGELWAAVAASAARLAVDLYLLGWRYRRFFRPFLADSLTERIDWRTEVWPMQWRLAAGAAVSFFGFSLFTPVLFHYDSAEVAGQMGMTWAVLSTLQMGALSWVQTRVPTFGKLIVERRYAELDSLFARLLSVSLAVLATGGIAVCGLVWILDIVQHPFAQRLLPLLPTGLFLLALLLYQIPHCQSLYLRAHKQEPLLPATILSHSLVGLAVWWGGSRYSATGMAAGYLAVVALFVVPYHTWLWSRCRNLWHNNPRMHKRDEEEQSVRDELPSQRDTLPSNYRLAFVVHALHSGGAERMTARIANDWAQRGHPVTLITLDSVESDTYEVDPRVRRIGLDLMRHSRGPLQALRNNRLRIRALRQAIADAQADAVVASTEKVAILTLLACRRGHRGQSSKRGAGVSSIDVFPYEHIDFRRHHIGPIWSWLRWWTYPRCTGLVVLSHRLRDAGCKLTRGRPVYVIPNAIEAPETHPVKIEGETERQPVLLAMGRLAEQKGFDLLLQAFAQIADDFPDWTLRILGDGPLRSRFEALRDSLQLQHRVQFAGWVPQPERELLQGRLFVFSSRFEGFGLALAEAMACGLPAVSFDCDTGPADIIRHEVDGLLVPPEDVNALAAAMRRLMSDDDERRRLAARAVEAAERFGMERFGRLWEAVLSGMSEEEFNRFSRQLDGGSNAAR